jgi:tRNA pseudouridine38-40 synthase
MRNIKLTIAYDGTDFSGWQRQQKERSVQGEIEKALYKIHKAPVVVYGAGRTDAGVHAASQCASFNTTIENIPAENFVQALNGLLPKDVCVRSACEVPQHFHARFSAVMRSYRYYFICTHHALPFENRYALQLWRCPDIKLLNSYSQLLHGELDCSLFASSRDSIFKRGSGCKSRYIKNAYFFYESGKLVFEISANAFFWKMVRSIVGTLLWCEEKKFQPEYLKKIMEEGKRKNAGTTVPPHGLFLWSIDYKI